MSTNNEMNTSERNQSLIQRSSIVRVPMNSTTVLIGRRFNENTAETGKVLSKNGRINGWALFLLNVIEEETIGTGKTFVLDIMDMIEQGFFNLEEATRIIEKVIYYMELNKKVICKKKSKYVYNFQSIDKVNRVLNLNEIQKKIYELYPSDPQTARLAMNHLSEEDRAVLNEVLRYDR